MHRSRVNLFAHCILVVCRLYEIIILFEIKIKPIIIIIKSSSYVRRSIRPPRGRGMTPRGKVAYLHIIRAKVYITVSSRTTHIHTHTHADWNTCGSRTSLYRVFFFLSALARAPPAQRFRSGVSRNGMHSECILRSLLLQLSLSLSLSSSSIFYTTARPKFVFRDRRVYNTRITITKGAAATSRVQRHYYNIIQQQQPYNVHTEPIPNQAIPGVHRYRRGRASCERVVQCYTLIIVARLRGDTQRPKSTRRENEAIRGGATINRGHSYVHACVRVSKKKKYVRISLYVM